MAYLHCRIRTLTSQLQEMDKNPSPYLSPSPAMQMSHYSLLSDQLTFLSPTSKLPFDKLNFKVFWMSGWVEPVSQDHCIVRPSPINGQFYKQFFMTLSFFVSSIYYRPQTKFGARWYFQKRVSRILFTGGGGGVSQHALQVVSQHALQVSRPTPKGEV